MPKGKRFSLRISVALTPELAEFLQDMVREGSADSLSGAARRCIALAKTYLPKQKSRGKQNE